MNKSDQKLHDYCGVFGITSKNHNVLRLTYLGLYALQHRGQESAGIAFYKKKDEMDHYKGMGLVSEVFSEETLQDMGGGYTAIGHVRYSTAGQSNLQNAQPLVVQYKHGPLAIAHNGNLTNATLLRAELEERGTIFQTQSDTEVIIHLIAQSQQPTIEDAIEEVMGKIEGAYSLLILTNNQIYAIRDPYGFRPLCLGVIGQDFCVASENCAFNHVAGDFIREIEPGEMVTVNSTGFSSRKIQASQSKKQCIFELIYLARPDSHVFGKNVYLARQQMGKHLAQESPVEADLVVPVPDSGKAAALGYSKESNIPFDTALLRNHYVGRTFIVPSTFLRISKVRIKLNPIKELIKGKRLIVVDDSIVRGTTSKEITQMLRQSGAKEIHFRISSPQIIAPCYYGIDTPTSDELIANSFDLEALKTYLGVDSITYLSIEGMLAALSCSIQDSPFCTACFTGSYPIPR